MPRPQQPETIRPQGAHAMLSRAVVQQMLARGAKSNHRLGHAAVSPCFTCVLSTDTCYPRTNRRTRCTPMTEQYTYTFGQRRDVAKHRRFVMPGGAAGVRVFYNAALLVVATRWMKRFHRNHSAPKQQNRFEVTGCIQVLRLCSFRHMITGRKGVDAACISVVRC